MLWKTATFEQGRVVMPNESLTCTYTKPPVARYWTIIVGMQESSDRERKAK